MDFSWSWPRFAESLRPEGGRTHGLKHMYSNFDCSGEFTHVSSFSLESRWKSALLAFYSLVHIINISTFGVNNNNHRINSAAVCVHPTQQHLLCTYCFDVFLFSARLSLYCEVWGCSACALYLFLFLCVSVIVVINIIMKYYIFSIMCTICSLVCLDALAVLL